MIDMILVMMLNNASLIDADMESTRVALEYHSNICYERNPITGILINKKLYNETKILAITGTIAGTYLLNEVDPVAAYSFNLIIGLAELIVPYVFSENAKYLTVPEVNFTVFMITF